MPRGGGLRVIAGSAGGRPLRGPRGHATRPTAGRLREALFSMLEAAGIEYGSVLDLYAGTGALGIEALSRGAEAATFVESDPRALAVVRENLGRTGFERRARVLLGRVGRWRPAAGEAYALVFADPPYDDAAAWPAIERTVEGALAPGAALVLEHSARLSAPPTLAGLDLWRDRRQGEGAVAVYRETSTVGGEDG